MKGFDFAPRESVLGIGSTDARKIAAGEWDTLYDEKRYQLTDGKEGKPFPDLTYVWKARLGLETEKLHRWWHAVTTEDEITEPPLAASGKSMVIKGGDPHKFEVFASIDGWIDSDRCALELKHTYGGNSLRQAADFYMAQLQWQMFVLGADRARFSVILGNEEPQWAYVEGDRDYQLRLYKQAQQFWQMLEAGERPDPLNADDELVAKAPTIKVGGTRAYDYATNNHWVSVASSYIELKPAAEQYKSVEKELRDLIPSDASEITGGGLIVRRDKRGACRITVAAPAQ